MVSRSEAAVRIVARPLPHEGREDGPVCFMLEDIASVPKSSGGSNVKLMRIEVIGEDKSSNTQVRAYAEYRVFAALGTHAPSSCLAPCILKSTLSFCSREDQRLTSGC
jgi:hypothetical protein